MKHEVRTVCRIEKGGVHQKIRGNFGGNNLNANKIKIINSIIYAFS